MDNGDSNGPPPSKRIGMEVLRGSNPGISVRPASLSGRYASIASTQPEAPGARKSSFTRHSNKALRVLVALTDPEVRKGVSRVLEKHGGEVFLANNLSEAYHTVESVEPGRMLVFVDPLLPGFEPRLIEMMRSHASIGGGPIVLISAISPAVLENTMRESFADGFIVTSKGLLHLDTALAGWLERLDMALAAG
jgi:PleD family two-component response regulator